MCMKRKEGALFRIVNTQARAFTIPLHEPSLDSLSGEARDLDSADLGPRTPGTRFSQGSDGSVSTQAPAAQDRREVTRSPLLR